MAQCARQNAGGNNENEQARPEEEPAEIHPHAAEIDAVTERNRHQNAKDGPKWCFARWALLEDGEQKEHRFKPFARHCEEHHGDQCRCLPGRMGEGFVDMGMQL